MNVYNKKMQGYKKLKKLLYFTKLYPIFTAVAMLSVGTTVFASP